ncbi:MAG: response regulator [Candidatus Omnitrophica bacterium]|nr:response regulator [Candidatus Omnitrophota bacterium]
MTMMTHQPRILVVEDDPDVASMLAIRLVAARYEAQIVRTGAVALGRLMTERPDLVLLDIQLPDISGYTVCEELRHRYERGTLPVVMFTVLDRPSEQQRGLAAGADAYLSKHDNIATLLKTIAFLLSSRPAPA